jgi:hypothetical protein
MLAAVASHLVGVRGFPSPSAAAATASSPQPSHGVQRASSSSGCTCALHAYRQLAVCPGHGGCTCTCRSKHRERKRRWDGNGVVGPTILEWSVVECRWAKHKHVLSPILSLLRGALIESITTPLLVPLLNRMFPAASPPTCWAIWIIFMWLILPSFWKKLTFRIRFGSNLDNINH